MIAFYYSKDNFEAATESTQKLVDKITTSEEKLKNTPAYIAMIKKADMNYWAIADNQEKTTNLEQLLAKFKMHNRLPVLDAKSLAPKYIMHKSMIHQFITEQNTGVDNLKKASEIMFSEIIKSETYKKIFEGFVTVKPDDTLALAKEEMERVKDVNCADIFVTADGKKDSAVLGWITNVNIAEKSRV